MRDTVRVGALVIALGMAACADMPGAPEDLASDTAALAGPATGVHRPVIIKTPKPYDRVVRAIESMGGTVKHQYRFVDAISAHVPEGGLASIRAMVGAHAVVKDVLQEKPRPPLTRFATPARISVDAQRTVPLTPEALRQLPDGPDGYITNSLGYMGMLPLFLSGYDGRGVVVAVLDDGLVPGGDVLDSDGSIIGGENVTGDGIPYLDPRNDGHGQFVSGMISGNVGFVLDAQSPFAQAIGQHCPACIIDGGDGTVLLPILGSAPSSSIYMVKSLPADDSDVFESDILGAMERVLLIKLAYLNGAPEVQNPDGSYDSLNIQVANMSLGSYTLNAGRDIWDQLTRAFGELDIVLTVSAGNQGPGGTTGGSPGTGLGGLTVGAASVAANERIAMDLLIGPGIGELFRANTLMQTAVFSSRGPTADGRPDPDLTSSGDWNIGQFEAGAISIGSGTSFSSPSVAGVAATVRQLAPWASAEEIQGALVQGADPTVLEDGSGILDRGAGYVNGTHAATLLLSGGVDLDEERRRARRSVRKNVDRWVQVVRSTHATRRARDLLPGQRYEIYYEVKPNTPRVTVTVHDVVPGAVQNPLFGDDIYLTIHSAKTHVRPAEYVVNTFTVGSTHVIESPEPGLMRVTLNGDWTNASAISASVTVEAARRTGELPRTARGRIVEGQSDFVDVEVPEGTAELLVELRWQQDWSRYPTSDIDVWAFDPEDNVFLDGATLDAPERFTIPDPIAGPWTFRVDGYTVWTGDDRWELSVLADGVRLRPQR